MTLVLLIACVMAFVLGARFLKIIERAVIAYEKSKQYEESDEVKEDAE